MAQPLVTINLVVRNGEKYIRHCLNAVRQQTYGEIEVNIIDNQSTDATPDIVAREYPQFNLIRQSQNLGMWPGQEVALRYSHGIYIVGLCVDVLLDAHFLEYAIPEFEKNPHLGALQAKIYQYTIAGNSQVHYTNLIDTCGFKLFRSRRVINIGQGEEDRGQYDDNGTEAYEIFGVEGAAPIFRRSTLEDIRIEGYFADPDYFWYGDDFDFAWRMRLFGWQQKFSPRVVAYHDRSTTKAIRKKIFGLGEFITLRQQIPIRKRALDYRNKIFTFIKNDHVSNVLRDLLPILAYQIPLLGYYLVFETRILLIVPTIIRYLPRMIRRRREIMKKARCSASSIHSWFQ